jgi:serine O-acetyltransferase
MISDLSYLAVRLLGGFWQFRGRMKTAPKGSISAKILRSIYFSYLERYGAYIGQTTKFASEACLPHNLHGIFIAGNAVIGRNCVIFQQVTIGANAIPDSQGVGSPTIGDNVYIGAGAKIIGGITIGDNCRIGANCVITKSIPPNAIAVLESPRVIERPAAPDNKYYRWSSQGPQYFDEGKWVLVTDPTVTGKLKQAL